MTCRFDHQLFKERFLRVAICLGRVISNNQGQTTIDRAIIEEMLRCNKEVQIQIICNLEMLVNNQPIKDRNKEINLTNQINPIHQGTTSSKLSDSIQV